MKMRGVFFIIVSVISMVGQGLALGDDELNARFISRGGPGRRQHESRFVWRNIEIPPLAALEQCWPAFHRNPVCVNEIYKYLSNDWVDPHVTISDDCCNVVAEMDKHCFYKTLYDLRFIQYPTYY